MKYSYSYRPERPTRLPSLILAALAIFFLGWTAQALAAQIAPPEDMSVERCELLNQSWWKCYDVNNNVALRPNVTR